MLEFEGYIGKNGQLISLEEGRDEYQEPYLLSPAFAHDLLVKFTGFVYTLVEASVELEKQKAVKDIIRDKAGEFHAKIVNHATNEEYIEFVTGGKEYDTLEDAEASVSTDKSRLD